MFSAITSIAALGISIFVLFETRRRDRRDLLLRIHEQLIGDDPQRGRHLLFQLGDRPVQELPDDDFRCINRALARYDVLGMYMEQGHVRKGDVMRLWAEPAFLAWRA